MFTSVKALGCFLLHCLELAAESARETAGQPPDRQTERGGQTDRETDRHTDIWVLVDERPMSNCLDLV